MAGRPHRRFLPAMCLLLGAIRPGAVPNALAQGTIDFTSTPIPGQVADALAAGPDGSLWFVSQFANTVNRVTFPDLHVSTFNVPTANAGLASITAGPDGNMWFTESTAKKIGRVDATGTFAEFPTPASAPAPQQIFPGPNGTLWAIACNFFGGCIFGPTPFIVTTTAGTATRLDVKTPSSKSFGASACTLGADGNVWCIGHESVQSPFSSTFKVARINPAGGYTAFSPQTGTQGSFIVAAPDGNVWYTWLFPGFPGTPATGVARVTPAGVITEYTIVANDGRAWIFGLAVGADGNLYFDDRGNNKLYELVLSTATGSGQPTINIGSIVIDTPEDLVAVSNQSGSSTRASPEDTTDEPCPETAFVARSGGSFEKIEWEETTAPTTCTNLIAQGGLLRGVSSPLGPRDAADGACLDSVDSRNPAVKVDMNFFLPPASGIQSFDKGSWDSCDVFINTETLQTLGQCKAETIDQGEIKAARFFGVFPLKGGRVNCTSDTPETKPDDNSYLVTNFSFPVFDFAKYQSLNSTKRGH